MDKQILLQIVWETILDVVHMMAGTSTLLGYLTRADASEDSTWVVGYVCATIG
jgi:hypothetical protein